MQLSRFSDGILFLVFYFAAGLAVASSEPESDLAVGLAIEPSRTIDPDTHGVIYVSATNHGPFPANPVMSFSKQLDGADYFLDFFPDAETAPCTYAFYVSDGLPGNPSFKGVALVPGVVDPGSTVTCRLGFRVGPEALGVVLVRANVIPGSQDGVDPDYSNNSIQTSIVVGAPVLGSLNNPTPIPLWDTAGILCLVLLLALAGGMRLPRS